MRKQPLKKIPKALAGAALALVVAWACAGGVLWQAARIVHYHLVRSEGGDEVAVDTVQLTAASHVVWIEKDELRYEGRMFDVREQKRIGDDWLLIGHYDAADDEIFELLHALFGLGTGHGKSAKKCSVFLPEATVLRLIQPQLLRATLTKPLHNPTPADNWRSLPRSAPEHPPQA